MTIMTAEQLYPKLTFHTVDKSTPATQIYFVHVDFSCV